MTLSRKTLLYTFIISLILLAFFIFYLVGLLPGLYVEYVNQQYINQFEESHLAFLRDEPVEDQTSAVTNSLRIIIPKAGDTIQVYSAFADVEIRIDDPDLLSIFNQMRQDFQTVEDPDGFLDQSSSSLALLDDEALKQRFSEVLDHLPIEITTLRFTPIEFADAKLYEARQISHQSSLMAFHGQFDRNEFMNMFAITDRDDAFVISWANVLTGSIHQILPISFQSLPMIILVVLVVVILASYLFSERIVRPITKVSRHARDLMEADYGEVRPLQLETGDEITRLANDLDELYRQLREQYQTLAQEHTRQEIFLRSGSHQLKTPITSSLLLLDGMIARVGKYADTETYLPKLREQLKQMQGMVESLLELQAPKDSHKQAVDVADLIERSLPMYRELAAAKDIELHFSGQLSLMADPEVLHKILDSLLGNAISYTRSGGRVDIRLGDGIEISNSPAIIEPSIFEHALEPFVSSNLEPGRGLGLYIARTNANLIGLDLTIERESDRVTARLNEQ